MWPGLSVPSLLKPLKVQVGDPFAVFELAFLMFQGRACRDGCVTEAWLPGPRPRTCCFVPVWLELGSLLGIQKV